MGITTPENNLIFGKYFIYSLGLTSFQFATKQHLKIMEELM